MYIHEVYRNYYVGLNCKQIYNCILFLHFNYPQWLHIFLVHGGKVLLFYLLNHKRQIVSDLTIASIITTIRNCNGKI